MKKVLFATTALVLSAGVAAAEVSLSGDARMGVTYTPDSTGDNEWNFSSRARVMFTMSGQTDGGLEFGAYFRANEAKEAKEGYEGGVFVAGAFGKIEMGDAVSAPEALFEDLPEVGFTDLATANSLDNDIPYLTGDGVLTSANNPVVLYTYSTGPFSFAASMSDGNQSVSSTIVDANELKTVVEDLDAQEYALAAAYTFDAYTVGLGYEILDLGDAGKAGQGELAAVATFGNTDLKAYYAWGNQDNSVDNAVGLGFSSKFNATTVMGYVQKVDFVDGAPVDDVTWWGLGASYDLGGGASVVGGLSDDDLDGSDVTADLGMKFKF